MPRLIARSLTLALAAVLTGGVALPAHAAPQSDGASRMSQASLEASSAASAEPITTGTIGLWADGRPRAEVKARALARGRAVRAGWVSMTSSEARAAAARS